MALAPTAGMEIAAHGVHRKIDALREEIERIRDAIAECELELEETRKTIEDFEFVLRFHLRDERLALAKVASMIASLERWSVLLERGPRRSAVVDARELDRRAGEQLEQLHEEIERRIQPLDGEKPSVDVELAAPDRAPRRAELKVAYRSLARRFHPDLARDHEEWVKFSRLMARINESYRAGDLEALRGLVGRHVAPRMDDADQPEVLVGRLERQRQWFRVVLDNRREDRQRLHAHPTRRLWEEYCEHQDATAAFFCRIADVLRTRVEQSVRDLRLAIIAMETAVRNYNARARSIARKNQSAVEAFDPNGSGSFGELISTEIELRREDPLARPYLDRVIALATEDPNALTLLLLTCICEQVSHPLPGLDTFDSLAERLATLASGSRAEEALEATLARWGHVVEYGVIHLSAQRARMGLRFRHDGWRAAVRAAWSAPPVRSRLRALCGVLGERRSCDGCAREVFAVPLIRSGGIDDLRALACPDCGATFERYWMAKGADIQSILNSLYVDLELVVSVRVAVAHERAEFQLAPAEFNRMTVGDFKRLVFEELFARNELPVKLDQLGLWVATKRLGHRKRLDRLERRQLCLKLSPKAAVDEAVAVELMRHQIRRRFRRDEDDA